MWDYIVEELTDVLTDCDDGSDLQDLKDDYQREIEETRSLRAGCYLCEVYDGYGKHCVGCPLREAFGGITCYRSISIFHKVEAALSDDDDWRDLDTAIGLAIKIRDCVKEDK
jgi:hypothetical protein